MVCLNFSQVGKGADILPISAAWDIAFQQSYPPLQWIDSGSSEVVHATDVLLTRARILF